MKILLVFPFLPYPPDDGGRIGFFNPIKYLSRRLDVSVICSTGGSDQESSVAELKKFCSDVRICDRSAWRGSLGLVRGMVLSPPGSAAKYWHPAAGKLIHDTIRDNRPDIVEFHHLNTAIYHRFAASSPVVLREHNVEYKVWERHAAQEIGWFEKNYARWIAPRVRSYEGEMAKHFDRCIVVSEADRAFLSEISPDARLEVIPSGVDTEYFYPLPEMEEEPWSMTLTGSFEWKPKQQSLHALLTRVFPLVKAKLPQARLYVVGKGIPPHLQRIGQETPGVTITGPVPDVRPYIARSALLINYLESGGGIALKVLEAMAMRRPVLCNSLACEGIPMRHGRDICVADGPAEFAAAACRLLQDADARLTLAEEGFGRVMETYSWSIVAARLEDCYRRVIEERRVANRIAAPKQEQFVC